MTKTIPEIVWRILLAVTQWGVSVRQLIYFCNYWTWQMCDE